ncbi:MAG: hypothetical protein ACR2NM_16030, partial [Bythopirellula sp.]
MRLRLLFLALLIVVSTCLSIGSAGAHPGHDHSVSTGVWPDHQSNDESAGFEAELAASSTGIPEEDRRVTAWKLADGTRGTSTDGAIDNVVSQILGDVNAVAYNANFVFVRTTGIPSHAVGPFNNPSTPGDVDATYRISCNPTEETGTKSPTGLGSIGVMINGAGFYNASDGTYWRPNNNGLTNPG